MLALRLESPSRRAPARLAAGLALAFAFIVPPALARGVGDSFAPLVKEVSPAVVNIAVTRELPGGAAPGASPFPPGSPMEEFMRRFGAVPERSAPPARRATGLGSGFVIDPAGYVVTNNHVVGDASAISVTFADGRQLAARLVGRDDKTDLALIKVESQEPLPFVQWGDSHRLEVGDWVLAVGNPFGLGGTVTAGIVSARGRDIQSGPFDDFIQLDAPINQGNSGGPSFDMEGKVIGVNTAIYSPNGGSVGIGFAIPAAVAKPVIDELRASGRVERGWIGVSAQPLTPEIAFGLGLPTKQEGALIAQLDPNGPAARAGLRQGDVVVAVDARPINRLRDLPRAVAAVKPDSKVTIHVLRRGSPMTIEVQVARTPTPNAEPAAASAVPTQQPVEPVGLALSALTPELRDRLRLAGTARGVLIAGVKDGSTAQNAGLAAGDLIVEVAGQAVHTPDEVVQALARARAQHHASLVMLVDRRGAEQFVAVRLPQTAS
jgi:serine protease Do